MAQRRVSSAVVSRSSFSSKVFRIERSLTMMSDTVGSLSYNIADQMDPSRSLPGICIDEDELERVL